MEFYRHSHYMKYDHLYLTIMVEAYNTVKGKNNLS